MFLSEISITRPIAAIVLSVLMLIFGIVSFSKLPVREVDILGLMLNLMKKRT